MIISMANQKGGVAKSTTAINLAAGLALEEGGFIKVSKSGLADSPFFTPIQPKVEPITPPFVKEPEKSMVGKNASPLPDSPTLEKIETTNSQAPSQELQDQKRTTERKFERTNNCNS